MAVPPLHACWAGPQPQPSPPAPGSRVPAPRPAPAPRPRPTVPPSGVTGARAPAARAASRRAVSGRISPVDLSPEEARAQSSLPGTRAAQPPRPSPSSAVMLMLALRQAQGRGRGRPVGGPRRARSLPWSPAWICCWALAGCQAVWAGDLSSSGHPLPACQEVSSTGSPLGVCGGVWGGAF